MAASGAVFMLGRRFFHSPSRYPVLHRSLRRRHTGMSDSRFKRLQDYENMIESFNQSLSCDLSISPLELNSATQPVTRHPFGLKLSPITVKNSSSRVSIH